VQNLEATVAYGFRIDVEQEEEAKRIAAQTAMEQTLSE
jgi:hypothetical protein